MAPDPALLERTLASIRSNFESLRRFDPVPALMAESPPGRPKEFGSDNGRPIPPVFPWDSAKDRLRWLGASLILEGITPIAGRNLWAIGPRSATERLNLAAEAAAGFAAVLRESVGLPKKSGASGPRDQWFWSVFEVAEKAPPYSLLRLKGGGVFRLSDGGGCRAYESQLAWVEANGLPPDPVAAAVLSEDFLPVRYWEVKDFTEASLWALDLVATALPAVIERERSSGGSPAEERPGEPVHTPTPPRESTEDRLRALYADQPDFVLEAPEKVLARSIERKPGAFTNCDYFQTVLRPLRAKRRAEIREGKRRLREAQRWGHFDSAAGRDDDSEENH